MPLTDTARPVRYTFGPQTDIGADDDFLATDGQVVDDNTGGEGGILQPVVAVIAQVQAGGEGAHI